MFILFYHRARTAGGFDHFSRTFPSAAAAERWAQDALKDRRFSGITRARRAKATERHSGLRLIKSYTH